MQEEAPSIAGCNSGADLRWHQHRPPRPGGVSSVPAAPLVVGTLIVACLMQIPCWEPDGFYSVEKLSPSPAPGCLSVPASWGMMVFHT